LAPALDALKVDLEPFGLRSHRPIVALLVEPATRAAKPYGTTIGTRHAPSAPVGSSIIATLAGLLPHR
jgi:hypothetical protein